MGYGFGPVTPSGGNFGGGLQAPKPPHQHQADAQIRGKMAGTGAYRGTWDQMLDWYRRNPNGMPGSGGGPGGGGVGGPGAIPRPEGERPSYDGPGPYIDPNHGPPQGGGLGDMLAPQRPQMQAPMMGGGMPQRQPSLLDGIARLFMR
jgi:hypothetical protein